MNIIQKLLATLTFCSLLMVLTGCRKSKVVLPQVSPIAEEELNSGLEGAIEPPKPAKSIKHMTVEEALEAVKYYEFTNHQVSLVAIYQHIISKSKDPEIVATYLIKLADLYLIDNNFEEAKKYYKKATMLYPGHKGIENARYREILAHFMSSLSPSRDQSATQATISLGKKYLEDFPHIQPDRIRSIIAASYKKLLASELLVINFYLNKFKLSDAIQPIKAALQRMDGITAVIIPQLKSYDTDFKELQKDTAWAQRVLIRWNDVQDELDGVESRARIIAQLQEAVSLLGLINEPAGLKSSVASDLRDKF